MKDLFPIFMMFLLAGGLVVTLILLAIFVGPKKHSKIKDDPFECGTVGTGDPNQRFSVKFYLVAMIFILFDVEIIYLYPWAVNAQELGWYGFWVMISFVFVLSVGLAYIWKRGVLDWL